MNGLLRFLGSVLLWVSLAFGAVAASTAYIVPVSLASRDPQAFKAPPGTRAPVGPEGYLRTTADAGPKVARDGVEAPLFPKGTELTPSTLERMIGDDPAAPVVRRVKVGAFSLERWDMKWWFAASVAGVALGGLLVRRTSRPDAAGEQGLSAEQTPTGALAASIDAVRGVLRDAPRSEDLGEALRLIVERLGELQQTHLPAFADARPVLVARLGLGGYAALMDRFAEGERHVNRAWAAAADGRVGPARHAPDMLAEALASLEIAFAALDEARARLG